MFETKKVFQKNFTIISLMIIVLSATVFSSAQTAQLPPSEKIINDYLKAAGGRKRLATVKNAVYDWKVTRSGSGNLPNAERAQTLFQNPSLLRFDLPGKEIGDANESTVATTATNGNTAWRRGAEGGLQTLTDDESRAFRLQAMLAATKLTDLKNQRVAAQVVGQQIVGGEAAYIVEFAVRNGAKLRYFFGEDSKLPIKIENPAIRYSACLSEYRQSVGGILEAHRVIEPCLENDNNSDFSTFELEKVAYDTNLSPAVFDAPPTLENFDLAALVEELKKNEESMLERVSEYSFVQKETERAFDGKGGIKKETIKTYEVFPTRQGRRVLKLVSENGVPLTGEKLVKEEQRVVKELEKSEAESARKQEKSVAGQKAEPERGGNIDPSEGGLEQQAILTILRVSEVYSPRFESFRDREAIVFNFRPRAGYKPRGFFDAVFSKLAGTVWIDREDKQIVRAETRVVENVKMGGGLLATFRKDSTIVFERAKFGEVWLPKSSQDNASAKFLLFGSLDAATITEYSNYNRYTTEVKDYKVNDVDKPKP